MVSRNKNKKIPLFTGPKLTKRQKKDEKFLDEKDVFWHCAKNFIEYIDHLKNIGLFRIFIKFIFHYIWIELKSI